MGKIKSDNCKLDTCRYNENSKCTNEEKRKECVEVSKKVLCIDYLNDDIARERDKMVADMLMGLLKK